jgi:hypothetical protein
MLRAFFGAMITLGAFALVGGCGGTSEATKPTDKKADSAKGNTGHEWWCDEHGVKEEDCSMCSAKAAKEFKAKGDWCEMHNRAKSQCFICDPGLKEKFAAEYRAKYGKEPPQPEGKKPEKK